MIHFRRRHFEWRLPRVWDLEPKTARLLFDRWVRKDGYRLLTGKRAVSVRKRDGAIVSRRLTDGTEVRAKVFLDASYEGDIIALATLPCTFGRESRKPSTSRKPEPFSSPPLRDQKGPGTLFTAVASK